MGDKLNLGASVPPKFPTTYPLPNLGPAEQSAVRAKRSGRNETVPVPRESAESWPVAHGGQSALAQGTGALYTTKPGRAANPRPFEQSGRESAGMPA
jgi:hypothetical protein